MKKGERRRSNKAKNKKIVRHRAQRRKNPPVKPLSPMKMDKFMQDSLIDLAGFTILTSVLGRGVLGRAIFGSGIEITEEPERDS